MSLATIQSRALIGIYALEFTVEAHLSYGLAPIRYSWPSRNGRQRKQGKGQECHYKLWPGISRLAALPSTLAPPTFPRQAAGTIPLLPSAS